MSNHRSGNVLVFIIHLFPLLDVTGYITVFTNTPTILRLSISTDPFILWTSFVHSTCEYNNVLVSRHAPSLPVTSFFFNQRRSYSNLSLGPLVSSVVSVFKMHRRNHFKVWKSNIWVHFLGSNFFHSSLSLFFLFSTFPSFSSVVLLPFFYFALSLCFPS